MYRSIFEICILFFPQKQSRFSFKPPFSHRCRGEPCLPAAQTTAALFREGSPHGKRAQAHTLRPCNPRMPVLFPQSRLSFKKNPARCASSAWHKTPLLNRLIFIKNVFLSYCPLPQTNFLSAQNRLSFSSFLWNYVGYPMKKSRVSRETKSVPAWK